MRLDELHPNPDNPRLNLTELDELTASIAELGVLVPLICTPRDGGGYDLVAGHRRRAAAIAAGLVEVPAIVRELGPTERVDLMVAENLHRVGLSPVEEAVLFARVMRERKITQAKLAETIHRSPFYVSTRLALLRLPKDVIEAVHRGELQVTVAIGLEREARRAPNMKGRKGPRRGLAVSLHTRAGHARCGPRCELRPGATADGQGVAAKATLTSDDAEI